VSGAAAVRPGSPPLAHAEPVMGTVVSFALRPGPLREPALAAAVADACGVLHQAERVFSTWDPGTPLSRFRRGERLADPPAALAEVRAACHRARAVSGGWFDPWAMPGGYDPTGLVKGWAVQAALESLRRAGLAAALVNGGGDLAVFGSPEPGQPWRAGVAHPWRRGALAAVIEVSGAMATSGSYERGAHLLDPHTRQPSCRAASATVTGPSLAQADALATALAVGGDRVLELIAGLAHYEGYLIRPDGSESWTPGMAFTEPRVAAVAADHGPAGPE
jgi:FAD:protein FMN transferase